MKLLLLLDFDGTLTPIVKKPSLAKLSASYRRLLKRLAEKPGIVLGVISGRALADVRQKVGLYNIFYAGNHGLEIQSGKKKFVHPRAKKYLPAIEEIYALLRSRTGSFRGVIFEHKGLSLSLHYRQMAKEDVPALKAIFNRVLKKFLLAGKVKGSAGKKVLEVRPAISWDKGRAVLWIMKTLKGSRVFPVFIGDDRTDEDAFKALKGRGISFLVGKNKRTRADFSSKSVKDVYAFLENVLQLF